MGADVDPDVSRRMAMSRRGDFGRGSGDVIDRRGRREIASVSRDLSLSLFVVSGRTQRIHGRDQPSQYRRWLDRYDLGGELLGLGLHITSRWQRDPPHNWGDGDDRSDREVQSMR